MQRRAQEQPLARLENLLRNGVDIGFAFARRIDVVVDSIDEIVCAAERVGHLFGVAAARRDLGLA